MTGGARGLGNEFCKAFVQSGCTDLAILDLKEEEAQVAAEELVKQSCRQFSFLDASCFLRSCFPLSLSLFHLFKSCRQDRNSCLLHCAFILASFVLLATGMSKKKISTMRLLKPWASSMTYSGNCISICRSICVFAYISLIFSNFFFSFWASWVPLKKQVTDKV